MKKLLAECTRDCLWGTGLSPYYTSTTSTFHDSNLLGTLLMEHRDNIRNGNGIRSIPPASIPWHMSYECDISKTPPSCFLHECSSQLSSVITHPMESPDAEVVVLRDDVNDLISSPSRYYFYRHGCHHTSIPCILIQL